MNRKKLLKKFGLGTMLCLAAGSTTIVAAACSIKGTPGVFRYFYNTDILKDNNSPLNPTFNNSPISTYANTILYSLVTYETSIVGELGDGEKAAEDGTTTYKDDLILEGALELEVFTSEEQMKTYDAAIASKQTKEAENNAPYKFIQGKTLKSQPGYDEAISNGTIYRFKINTNNKWIDSNRNEKASLSGKDFERAIESYKLAASIGYNRNGYFLSLMGLDFDKTVGMSKGDSSVAVTSPEYDVENYKNTDDTFTMYLTEPYPYALDLLSKEYFAAIPHTNPKVHNINAYENSPIVIDKTPTSSGGTSYMLNRSKTDFNQLYGSGDITNFTKDVWYAGSYYISSFTSTQIIFEINPKYFDDKVMGGKLLNNSLTRIPKIVETYGSGTVDTYYELFKSGQNDYLPSVPATKKSEAAQHYVNNGLQLIRTSKLAQSNYITFTPKAYTAGGDSISKNDNISTLTAQFINNWNSEDSTVIRAGIAGLINHKFLSLINLPSSGDFQLSSIPFGTFDNYYQTIANSNDNATPLLGGLARPYSDFNNNKDKPILGEFSIPIYEYTDSGINIKTKVISKETFNQALTNIGASTSNKLQLMAKFGEGTFTTNYNNYLVSMKQYIEELSGGKIEFIINARNGAKPSANEWFNNQSAPIGFSYWSPDYNGVGTWLEASTLLGSTTVSGKSYEGYPSSNAHNSWLTYFESMVTGVKMMNATLSDTSAQNGQKLYKVGNDITNDPFANDNKIQGAFNDKSLESFGIKFDASEASTTIADNEIKKGDAPGVIYGKLAVQFVNYLIENNVIKADKFQEYVNNPSKLKTVNTPKTVEQLIIGTDVFNDGQSANFSKYLGIFAGQSTVKGLWSTVVNDSDYSYIPRSETGLDELTFALVNPNYTARVSTVTSPNFRDFSWNK